LGALSAAIANWASIMLAALPYVVFGALAAGLLRRLARRRSAHGHSAIALLAVLNPGCDCALNGFAGALACARPAIAGFALTFAAAASPASLAVTYASFGMRMTIARVAGGTIAAALTAAAWHWHSVGPTFVVGQPWINLGPTGSTIEAGSYSSPEQNHGKHEPEEARELAAALRGVAFAAAAAVVAKAIVPSAAFAHMTPTGAALLGALLSPCSTSDPLLAVALLRDVHAQLAFMLAAQCLDVRQMLLLLRHFGVARMLTAAVSAAVACALTTMFT
jgi:uncharacterized membrane protein YraQ (UPF0718 family)